MYKFLSRPALFAAIVACQLASTCSWADTTSIDFDALPNGFFPSGQTVTANEFTTITSQMGYIIGPSFFDDEDAITIQNFGSGDVIFTFDSEVTVNGLTLTGRSNNSPVRITVYDPDGDVIIELGTDAAWDSPTDIFFGQVGSIGVRLLESEIRSITIDFGSEIVDADGDGVADAVDNCSEAANADQQDSNGDGFGNMCDSDLNEDCVVNVQDLGLLRKAFFTDDEDADFNGDDTVNVVDLGIMKSGFFEAPGPSATGTCEP